MASSYSDEFGGGGWSGFEDYIKTKNQRIKEQLQVKHHRQEEAEDVLSIFQGCRFAIDGRTQVLDSELKALIIQHGGIYEYWDLKGVTHFIADNLAMGNQRWRHFRDRSTPKPYSIITSKWIIDSIAANRRLPENLYMPEVLLQGTGQGRQLMASFLSRSAPDSLADLDDAEICIPDLVPEAPEMPSTPLPDDASQSSTVIFSTEQPSGSAEQVSGSQPEKVAGIELGSPSSDFTTAAPQRSFSSGDPNFVRNFFKRSRLHFIGRWRERVFSKFRFTALTPPSLPAESTLKTGSDRAHFLGTSSGSSTKWSPNRICHVDFDSFFVSVAIKKSGKAELEQLPVGVGHGSDRNERSSSELSSCNYVARSYGVRKGMYVRDALALCPNLIILNYEFEEIEACSLKLLHILIQVTPRVMPVSCDEAYLQLLDWPDVRYAVFIANWIRYQTYRETGCTVSIGIGDSLLTAKMASSKAKPSSDEASGVYAIPMPRFFCDSVQVPLAEYLKAAGDVIEGARDIRTLEVEEEELLSKRLEEIRRFFVSVEIGDLFGVGPSALELFEGCGVKFCGDIDAKNISLNTLREMFGPEKGLSMLEMARGVDRRALPTKESFEATLLGEGELDGKRSLTVSVNWGVRFYTESHLNSFLRQMAEETASRIEGKKVGADQLTLKVGSSRVDNEQLGDPQILVRHPDAPVMPSKFGGCGKCNQFTGKGGPFIVPLQTREQIYSAASSIWSKDLKGHFELEDVRGVTFVISKFTSLAGAKQPTLAGSFAQAAPRITRTDTATVPKSSDPISTSPINVTHAIRVPSLASRRGIPKQKGRRRKPLALQQPRLDKILSEPLAKKRETVLIISSSDEEDDDHHHGDTPTIEQVSSAANDCCSRLRKYWGRDPRAFERVVDEIIEQGLADMVSIKLRSLPVELGTSFRNSLQIRLEVVSKVGGKSENL